MIKSKNFISIVYLGNFNPVILNKEFLEQNKIIKFVEEPTIKTAPVFTNIIYRNLKIIIDLDRFQITEEKIEDFLNNNAINIAYEYLNILKYTPLRAVGVNLNIGIELENLNNFLDKTNTKNILDFFNAKSYILKTEKLFEEEKEDIIAFNLIIKITEDKLVQINIQSTGSNNYQVNYNFEVRDLNKIPENRNYIKENFNKILEEYNKAIEFLFNNKK